MTGDTISRAAALDALGERPVVWSDNDDYTLGERNQYDMDRLAIETVPSTQPGWISVTKRLPKADEEDENGHRKAYLVQQLGWKMHTARYDGEYWILWDGWKVINNVVAWMPLPERWRGDGK